MPECGFFKKYLDPYWSDKSGNTEKTTQFDVIAVFNECKLKLSHFLMCFCFQHFLSNWDIFSWLLWRLTSIKTQRIYKKPRRLTKKCHFNRNPDLVTTLSLNVDSSKTFKKQEEAKSDVKIVESIVVSPKLFNIMRPWDIPDSN